MLGMTKLKTYDHFPLMLIFPFAISCSVSLYIGFNVFFIFALAMLQFKTMFCI